MSLVRVDLSLLGLPNASRNFIPNCATVNDIQRILEDNFGLPSDHYYLVNGGKKINNGSFLQGNVQVVPRICGGKGGFGSMLRAIGAQIEKTTNREACRDLSGRRLRDINEEQRLKKWISQQAEREREVEESRKRKLEKLSAEPKHDFKDEKYEAERTELTEKLYNSVEQGLKASTSGVKRTLDAPVSQKKKKKLHYFDDEFSSSEESGSELEPKINVEATSEKDSSNTSDASVDSKNLLVDQEKNNENVVSLAN